MIEFVPYYEGFKGSVSKIDGESKFLIKGVYEKIGEDKIQITELPVGTWTMPYTNMLEQLMDGATDKSGKKITPIIKDMVSFSTEVNVDFTITLAKGKLKELESKALDANGVNGLEKALKLATTVSTTNMHMFDEDLKLHKYNSVEEIIDGFTKVRLDKYEKRKAAQLTDMRQKLVKLSNKAKYIKQTLNGTIDLQRKTVQQITELLESMEFVKLDGDYKYLIKMPMDSVSEENVVKIMEDKENMTKDLDELSKTTVETIWLRELDVLEQHYGVYKKHRESLQIEKSQKSQGGGSKISVTKKVPKMKK